MTDSEPVNISTTSKKKDNFSISIPNLGSTDSDFLTAFINIVKKINFKIGILIFFVGIIIFSNIFIEKVLIHFEKSSVTDNPTTKGTMIQLLFLCLFYIVIDLLSQYEII